MERNEEGGVAAQETRDAEDRADLLALELLAPLTAVAESLAGRACTWSDIAAQDLRGILIAEYGLPRPSAVR